MPHRRGRDVAWLGGYPEGIRAAPRGFTESATLVRSDQCDDYTTDRRFKVCLEPMFCVSGRPLECL